MLTRRPPARADGGFTLVALLVAIAVLCVVVAGLTALMLGALTTNRETTTRLTESRDIQFATARKNLSRESGEQTGLLSDEDVWKFITEQYNKARQPVAGYDLVFTPMKSI